ncbi:hypothetical protein [Bacteroides sp. 224]|uniref:hypothetical protein n=1 Tax=Bacteroides sp. 224 TaxID=2302936 RepID=UPI0013D3823C|nr:hypothetical protein [Bacteroides sp. 224]NDV64017.1 hypothetical protein [Bacteroides sp. 224]
MRHLIFKVIHITFFTLVLFACNTENKKENHLTYLKLNGTVRSVSLRLYEGEEGVAGKLKKKKSQNASSMWYFNENGFAEKQISYWGNQSVLQFDPSWIRQFTYNEKDSLIEINDFNPRKNQTTKISHISCSEYLEKYFVEDFNVPAEAYKWSFEGNIVVSNDDHCKNWTYRVIKNYIGYTIIERDIMYYN